MSNNQQFDQINIVQNVMIFYQNPPNQKTIETFQTSRAPQCQNYPNTNSTTPQTITIVMAVQALKTPLVKTDQRPIAHPLKTIITVKTSRKPHLKTVKTVITVQTPKT